MKEFLQSIFKSTEDRIKNPFIGTFITSWILFNWKPILFLLFSEKKIEEKISIIIKNYNDVWCYLWMPLISAIFYIVVLPYLSFIFEYVIKFSHEIRNKVNLETRNAALKLQIGVAQNEIKLEEEKTTFRERNSHNQMMEGLLSQNKMLSESLDEANKTHLETVKELQKQSEANSKEFNDLAKNFEKELKESNQMLNEERSKTIELRNGLAKLEEQNYDNINSASQLKTKLELEKFQLHRLKNPTNKVMIIDNYEILEYFNKEKEAFYYDVKANKMVSTESVFHFSKDKTYSESSLESIVNPYITKMFKILPLQE